MSLSIVRSLKYHYGWTAVKDVCGHLHKFPPREVSLKGRFISLYGCSCSNTNICLLILILFYKFKILHILANSSEKKKCLMLLQTILLIINKYIWKWLKSNKYQETSRKFIFAVFVFPYQNCIIFTIIIIFYNDSTSYIRGLSGCIFFCTWLIILTIEIVSHQSLNIVYNITTTDIVQCMQSTLFWQSKRFSRGDRSETSIGCLVLVYIQLGLILIYFYLEAMCRVA